MRGGKSAQQEDCVQPQDEQGAERDERGEPKQSQVTAFVTGCFAVGIEIKVGRSHSMVVKTDSDGKLQRT